MSGLSDVIAQVKITKSAGRPRGAVPRKSARHRFLEVGTDIVRSNGIRHLTIGELTRRVGVAKSTFYLRFTSREELLEAVLHDYVSALLNDANTAARSASRGLQRLVRMIEVWIQHYVMKQGGCLLLNGSVEYAGTDDDAMRVAMLETVRAWRSRLAAQIQEAVQLGQLRPDVDADQLLFEIFSVVLGVQHDCRFLGEPIGFRIAMLNAVLERHGAELPPSAHARLSV